MEVDYWFNPTVDNRHSPHSPFNTGRPLSISVSVWMASNDTMTWKSKTKDSPGKHKYIIAPASNNVRLVNSASSLLHAPQSRHKSLIRDQSAVPVDLQPHNNISFEALWQLTWVWCHSAFTWLKAFVLSSHCRLCLPGTWTCFEWSKFSAVFTGCKSDISPGIKWNLTVLKVQKLFFNANYFVWRWQSECTPEPESHPQETCFLIMACNYWIWKNKTPVMCVSSQEGSGWVM